MDQSAQKCLASFFVDFLIRENAESWFPNPG